MAFMIQHYWLKLLINGIPTKSWSPNKKLFLLKTNSTWKIWWLRLLGLQPLMWRKQTRVGVCTKFTRRKSAKPFSWDYDVVWLKGHWPLALVCCHREPEPIVGHKNEQVTRVFRTKNDYLESIRVKAALLSNQVIKLHRQEKEEVASLEQHFRSNFLLLTLKSAIPEGTVRIRHLMFI